MEGLPRAVRGTRDYLNALTYSVQSPPIVVGDVVITPASISSLVIKKEQIPGWIRGYDVRTGKLPWTFRTVPRPGRSGHETWKGDSWRDAGKVTVWTAMSADEELGLRLPADQHRGARLLRRPPAGQQPLRRKRWCVSTPRPGAGSGASRPCTTGCGTTTTPPRPTCSTSPSAAGASRRVAQVTKQGFVYTFDRVTGEPVWPIEERPVPPSDVPGEQASPTQPFPTRPAPFEYQGVTDDDLVDFTPESAGRGRDGGRQVPSRAAVHAAVAGRARSSDRARSAAPTGAAPRSIPRPACSTCRRATRSA